MRNHLKKTACSTLQHGVYGHCRNLVAMAQSADHITALNFVQYCTWEYVSPSETDWSSFAHQKMEAMPCAQPKSMLNGVTTYMQHLYESRTNSAGQHSEHPGNSLQYMVIKATLQKTWQVRAHRYMKACFAVRHISHIVHRINAFQEAYKPAQAQAQAWSL